MAKTSFMLRVNTKDGFKHVPVPEPVYIYVRQLENFIVAPEESKLLEAYPHLKVKKIIKI
jgi:hypothetical protein